MNNSLKTIGIIALACFSFYYTHHIALLMQQKDPLYQAILMQQKDKEILSVDATIDGDYIIPGLCGRTVDIEKSFQKMKNTGAFVETYLIYKEISPTISTSEYQDKIIKKGNSEKMFVSFILSENSNLIPYLEQSGIAYSILTTKTTLNQTLSGERINADWSNYQEIEKSLNKNKINKNLCVILGQEKDFCTKEKKTMIEPSFKLNNSNFSSLYKQISRGDIIYIDHLNLDYFQLLVENLVYKGIGITYLSNLISESRN